MDNPDDAGAPEDKAPEDQAEVSEAGGATSARHQNDLSTTERFRRSTTAGALAGALSMGMAKVFDPARVDTITVEQPAPAPPEEPEGVEIQFDPESAQDTIAIVRQGPAMEDPAPEP